jgi:hypothetical protein
MATMSGTSLPLVGISTYPPNAQDNYELPEAYVAAVRRAGGRVTGVVPRLTAAATAGS